MGCRSGKLKIPPGTGQVPWQGVIQPSVPTGQRLRTLPVIASDAMSSARETPKHKVSWPEVTSSEQSQNLSLGQTG